MGREVIKGGGACLWKGWESIEGGGACLWMSGKDRAEGVNFS